MNPPFGDWSLGFKDDAKKLYPFSSSDILNAFVERSAEMLVERGLMAAITSRTSFYLSSQTEWRSKVILGMFSPRLFVDLGNGVMDDAMVESCAYVLNKK
jgi:hypothetical protein